jgi:hypothetical protein
MPIAPPGVPWRNVFDALSDRRKNTNGPMRQMHEAISVMRMIPMKKIWMVALD